MLTITELIAVISLCVAFYSLGYVCGKHDAKIEKKPPIDLTSYVSGYSIVYIR